MFSLLLDICGSLLLHEYLIHIEHLSYTWYMSSYEVISQTMSTCLHMLEIPIVSPFQRDFLRTFPFVDREKCEYIPFLEPRKCFYLLEKLSFNQRVILSIPSNMHNLPYKAFHICENFNNILLENLFFDNFPTTTIQVSLTNAGCIFLLRIFCSIWSSSFYLRGNKKYIVFTSPMA